jgi:hypothetical protein
MHRFALLLPVACALACGDATQPAPPARSAPVSSPSLTLVVPHGAAASTSCEQGVQGNVEVEPHFSNPAVPEPVFTDPDTTVDPNLPNQCGSLVFNNRTRVATTVYATQSDSGENPWKYWWRRARFRDNETGVLTEVRKVSVGPDTLDTAVVDLPLSDQYDVIGVVLLTTTTDTFTVSDLPFTSTTPGPWGDVNFKFQHWARITPPSVTSVTHEDGYITVRWSNTNAGRFIDSTVIYRNGSQLDVVAGADSTYTHPSPGNGIWTYTLKHVSWPAALAPPRELAFPNSDTSNAITITLGTACARLAEPTGDHLTWLHADQYVSAGCSQLGSNKRFRWYDSADVELTDDWTTDTLFDFEGHFHTGPQLVILKDSNTTTHATSRDTVHFTVYNHQLNFDGESYVTRKGNYLYVAWADDTTHHGYWFERYADGPQWYPATATKQDSLYRTWPAGDYTVDLRQHLNTGVLHRRRLVVDVCTVPGCSAPPAPPVALSPGTAAAADWGLFGAGPWLGWGAADLRQHRAVLRPLGHARPGELPFADVGVGGPRRWSNQGSGDRVAARLDLARPRAARCPRVRPRGVREAGPLLRVLHGGGPRPGARGGRRRGALRR